MSALRDPGIPHGETTTYRGLVRGREVGTGIVTVERPDGARPLYVQRTDIHVEGGARYALVLDFERAAGTILAEHYRIATSYRDRPVAVEEGWFKDVRALGF